jgi:hypothetical protein
MKNQHEGNSSDTNGLINTGLKKANTNAGGNDSVVNALGVKVEWDKIFKSGHPELTREK